MKQLAPEQLSCAADAALLGGPVKPGHDSVGLRESYEEFLRAKVKLAPALGFDVLPMQINPALKDFVREAVVPWAAAGGRRAIFASFGLHKTSAKLELCRLAMTLQGVTPLIVLPLGVRQEFFDDAARWFTGDYAVKLNFIRRTDEARDDCINLTNYESVREGKIDAARFGCVSLDEAAILRGFGGSKTFREFMNRFEGVKYRFVATATPDPNEFIELLAYSAFLGVMDVGQAKTRFFKRDSTQADKLTLHPHKEREFWLWVASWALFIRRPSDLGYADDGYNMPALDVRWHEVPSDHRQAGAERDGQQRMFRDPTISVSETAKEKRLSLDARMEKLCEIRAEDPGAHRIIWHDLEAEREAIEKAVPEARSIFGSQDLEENEKNAIDFKYGRFAELATKPRMSGAGCNFQHHCHRAVFLGIGHKFHDFIQAVHRLQRFGQTQTVRIDLIYTDAERAVRKNLEDKWRRHEEQAEIMSGIIREYGLARMSIASTLHRSIGVQRREVSGTVGTDARFARAPSTAARSPSPVNGGGNSWDYRIVNNDCVEEARWLPDASVDLIVTSIPFSTQYEYTPSYNDFGHSDDDAQFWRQMDFLTPQLLRVLKPGRVAAVHVKDRIVPGGINGLGFQTVNPFSDECSEHFRRHGFALLARKTITTDVVRENNQTYRLGWTEQCKDGSRMGAGMPEYLLLFRRPPSDLSDGYADVPVVKEKPLCDDRGGAAPFDPKLNWKHPVPGTGYSRARWQFDAHGFMRSSGDRLITRDELKSLPHEKLYKIWRERSADLVYDYETHVRLAEEMDHAGRLPSTFMLLPPHSWHDDVWSDVARMRTLNMQQQQQGREMHLCPLQFDIVERCINQLSMPGETVLDPFGGIMTVPYCALKLGRRGIGIELSGDYWSDGVAHVQGLAEKFATPSLFDTLISSEAISEAAE